MKNKIKSFKEHSDFAANSGEDNNDFTLDKPSIFQIQVIPIDNSNLRDKKIQKSGTFIEEEGHLDLPEVPGTQDYPTKSDDEIIRFCA